MHIDQSIEREQVQNILQDFYDIAILSKFTLWRSRNCKNSSFALIKGDNFDPISIGANEVRVGNEKVDESFFPVRIMMLRERMKNFP